MKIIKVIDEDTLEMRDMVVEEDEKSPVDGMADIFRQALSCTSTVFAEKYKKFIEAKEQFDEIYEPFKANLLELHKSNPNLPKTVMIEGTVKVTYVSPSTRNTIDSKKLKEEEPELVKKFTKTSNVNATVRLEKIV